MSKRIYTTDREYRVVTCTNNIGPHTLCSILECKVRRGPGNMPEGCEAVYAKVKHRESTNGD